MKSKRPLTAVRWTPEEETWLRENGAQFTAWESAAKLNRTPCSLMFKLRSLGVRPKPRTRMYRGKPTCNEYWSDAQLTLLREQAGKTPLEELASKLGRSPMGTHLKARSLGLSTAMNY